jgi:hypothetical protein
MKKLLIKSLMGALVLSGFSLSLESAVYLTENFESGQTTGEKPVGGLAIRPATNTATEYTTIVSGASNLAGNGVGNGVKFYDNGSVYTTGIEYNFVANTASQVSGFQVSFDLAQDTTLTGDGTQTLFFGSGIYDSSTSTRMNAAARRFFDVRFANDGTVDVVTTSSSVSNTALNTGSNHLDIFVNDLNTTNVSFMGPDSNITTLSANGLAVFLNSALIYNDTLDTLDATAGGTISDTENNFGRLGFYTGTTSLGIAFQIDNLLVQDITAVPESSSIGLLFGLISLGFVYKGRKNKS